ncbi:iojap family protein [Nitzschia inconspicua]|uniref:Iojap family protein n=1 Tax=Nitzschia inconspicua TaxID=303405 RepID=A0A9K3KIS5_9STRA|nr:iojap family protein [Nitzschia inconspicua]
MTGFSLSILATSMQLLCFTFAAIMFASFSNAWINVPLPLPSGNVLSPCHSINNQYHRALHQHKQPSPTHNYLSSSCSTTALFKVDKSKDMIDFIEEPRNSKELVGDITVGPPETDDLADLVLTMVRAADARKAENIVALRVSKVSTVTSFIVIVTGNSRPQNQAIAASVKNDVEELYGLLPGSTGVPEGSPESGWTVLDYGSVMVHVMTPKSRLFYNVEGQWKDKGAEYMNLADVVLPNTVPIDSGAKVGTMQGIPKEDDPFWS